jgi:rhodanese-related sulfurtransferase
VIFRQPTKSYALYLLAFAVLPLLVRADDFLSPGLSPAELLARLESPAAPLVVDVRKPVEFGIAHIPGAINIPLTELEGRIDELRHEHGVLIYCINGARTRQAEPILYANDIENVYHLDGALQGWIQGKYPIEKGGVKKTSW